MEHTDDPARIEALLHEHQGWSAMVWKFSPSLRRLLLRVYQFSEARELYVLCVGCQTIAGSFDWKEAQLRFSRQVSPQGESLYWIQDVGAGFRLSCNSGIVVSVGLPTGEWLRNFDSTEELPA